MKTLPGGRVKLDEEEAYLAECHKTKRDRPDVRAILEAEKFFDAAARTKTTNEWGALRDTTWPGRYAVITGVSIMSALRAHLSRLQKEVCCYCGQALMRGGYSRQLDHVLPASVYGRFSFHFWNLAVACERCNRIKKANGYQPIDIAGGDYPEHSEFSDYFHPRFHPYADHVQFAVTGTQDYSYVVYVGISKQGRQLVDDVLTAAALEMTRESNDPAIRAATAKIRTIVQSQGPEAQAAMLRFEHAIREAIEAGAA